MAFKPAPLNTTFLAASIIGLLVSIFYIPRFSETWAFAFGIVFLIMLVAAIISMTRAAPEPQLWPTQAGAQNIMKKDARKKAKLH